MWCLCVFHHDNNDSDDDNVTVLAIVIEGGGGVFDDNHDDAIAIVIAIPNKLAMLSLFVNFPHHNYHLYYHLLMRLLILPVHTVVSFPSPSQFTTFFSFFFILFSSASNDM